MFSAQGKDPIAKWKTATGINKVLYMFASICTILGNSILLTYTYRTLHTHLIFMGNVYNAKVLGIVLEKHARMSHKFLFPN